ncbi:MAG: DUF167 domain-containing protein [Candidatus Micrarchaeota archaeon]
MLLELKVTPNAKKFGFRNKNGWKASVASPPNKGKANKELEFELSKLLSCPVRVIKGASSRRKVLEVDLEVDEFSRRTKAYLEKQGP